MLAYAFMSNHFHIFIYVPLMEKGIVERTDPENPMSPRQEYKLA